jgi:hypothetical protein
LLVEVHGPDWEYNRMGKVEGDRGDLEAAERHFRKALDFTGQSGIP